MKTLSLNTVKNSVIQVSILIFFIGSHSVQGAERGEYDIKWYPGSICRDADASNPYQEVAAYTDVGYVVNKQSRNRLTVICPLVRDNVDNRRGIGAIGIFYADNHASENIACSVKSRRLSGRSYDNSQTIQSAETGSDTLWLGSPVNARPGDSYFYVQCSIPRSSDEGFSMIKSITIVEDKT